MWHNLWLELDPKGYLSLALRIDNKLAIETLNYGFDNEYIWDVHEAK